MKRLHILLEQGHTPIQLKIGNGNPGPKTCALLQDEHAIKKAGFYFPDHVAFTPRFFRRILLESGALKDKNPEKKLKTAKFSPKEKEQIRDAIMAFHPLLRPYLMVRSDDYASGVGLWHTGGAAIRFTENISNNQLKMLANSVELQMKLVLASDFRSNVRIFKEKMGIVENPGVLLMPAFGKIGNDSRRDEEVHMVTPPISINFLGRINELALVAVGAGMGGANEPFAHSAFKRRIEFGIFLNGTLGNLHARKPDWPALTLNRETPIWPCDISKYLDMCRQHIETDSGFEQWERINKMIGDLLEITGPRYLEMVADDCEGQVWVVTQSAPFAPRIVQRPKIEEGNKIHETYLALGTSIAKGTEIRFASGDEPNEEDIVFNQTRSNYLLVLYIRHIRNFNKPGKWGLESFSNAGAVVLITPIVSGAFGSHLGGHMRELGIPVIGIEGCADRIDRLKKELTGKKQWLVYADEFKRQGVLAAE
ncbi:hypothetical protein KKF81_03970 [Candidatus Micrarchaeota archaeon]|nr:hypothetical protein [Candidatus Micrarchaeota archaeon]MBU1166082.1 hypothetical protein [Candidatus Micrarchaeota archaeon]MBU1886670.1 hypothetical protein [Candidatus Micrarchaeota archaeon]